MATREQLIEALKKADAVGNTEDAKKLANYIKLTSRTPNQQKEGTAGFFEGLVGGTKNILSASQTAVEAPFISGEEASLRGIERQKERTERPGFSLDEITKAYKEDGIFSAAGETLSQVPGAIGEQLPFLASMKAGFMAGSALPLPPQAKALAGVAGSLLAPFLVSSGSAMERKASEQLKKGDKVDINELGAYGTGLASAGLERAALGLSGLSKVMGIDFLKGAGTETAEQIARRSLAATLAKGGTKLVLAESPTEAGQQLLERYYAGLSLTDEEAQREYVEAAAGAAILAPLGMAGSGYQRSQAKKIIQKRKDEIERVAEENKRIQEEKIRAQEQAEAITAEEAKLERQRIEQEAEQKKLEIEIALEQARQTGQYIKPVKEIINDIVIKKPLTKKQLNKKRKEFKEALNLPSGYFDERDAKFTTSDVDPETGERTFVERELTQAEAMNIPVVPPPQFNPAKDAVTKEFITSETKGLGIGGTAKAFGLDHGDGPVPFLKDFLNGKNPRDLKDNEMIRLTLNENLKTRRKGLDNAPSLKAQQKRKEVITKIETYLDALPTEGEILNEQFIDEAVRRGDEMAGRPLDPADAALSSIADAGRTDESAAAINESTGREGEQPPALDPVTGKPIETFTKEEIDTQQAEQLEQQAAKLKKGANKTRSFNTLLNKIGIAKEDMLDIMGESKMPRKGVGLAFRTGAPKFVDSLKNGVFNDYLPFNIRLGDETTYEQLSERTDKAFEYLTSAMREGRNLKPFTAELDFEAANNLEKQAEEIKPTTTPTQEAAGAIVDINGESIPQTLIDAYKSRKSDRDSTLPDLRTPDFYRELEKYLGPVFSGRTVSDLENLLEEYIKSQPQDLRYVVFGKIKGTDIETVWQEKVGGKQRAEEIAKTLEQEGKATDTRVQEYDLNLGPMGIPQESTTQPAATPTQEQRVKQTLEGSDTPLTIKEIAEQTNILEPNVRRITGQGAKTGKFERVDKGVYTLTTPDGKKVAHIEVGDAVNVLPKLVEQGEKFNMIFLDPAYYSSAVTGGNKGIKKYKFMYPPEFKKAMESVPDLIKNNDGHVYLMLSGARTAQKDMLPYLNAMNEVGLSVVGEGSYTKMNKNGSRAGFPTPAGYQLLAPERVFLFTKSGIARKGEKTLDNLDFRFVRPNVRTGARQSEKAPELLNALITNSTLEGESVLDPFAGSGVTGAEAVKAGRQATLIEKSQKAVDDFIIPKIEGEQDNIQESRTGPPDTERDKLLAQYRADKYMEDSHIRQGERVPKWLQARLKKLEAQLKVQESRNIEGTGESRAAVIDSLRKEFGPDIDKSIESGQLVVVDYLSELPYTTSLTGTANGAYSLTSNKVYIVASKVTPGQGRKVLLHELGEHYGLERLLGKDYKSTLNRLKTLKNTDPEVEAIWASVKRDYPDLTENSQRYLQEVMARVGERAPRSTIFKRVMSLVKNFLRKLGFFNPNKLSTADLQDMIAYSTRVSLAKSGEVQPSSIKDLSLAMQFSKEESPDAFKAAQEAATKLLGLPPDNTAMDRAKAMGFDVDNIFYHGTTKDFDAFELDPNKVGPRERDFSYLGKAYEGQYYFSGDGIYLTQNQEVARYFALNTFSGEAEAAALATLRGEKPTKGGLPKVMPLMIKGEIFDFRNPEHIERIKQPYQNYNEFEKGLPGTSRFNKTEINNIAKGLHSTIETNHVIFQRLGFDGAKMFEPKRFFSQQNLDKNAITTVIYNPVNIKSTDAAFNPENITSPNLMFSKVANDVPAGLEATEVYLAGNNDNSKKYYENFVEGFENAKNNPKESLQNLYAFGSSVNTSARINLAYSGAGIERKLINEFEGAITDGYGTTRADIIMAQALESNVLAAQSSEEGRIEFTEAGTATVVKDRNNINSLIQLRQQLADQTSVEFAEGLLQSYTSARRYRLELDRLEQRARNIAAKKAVIKTAKKDLKTAKGNDKKVLDKLIADYQKQNAIDEQKNKSVEITDEQKAAIAPGLAYAQQYPLLIEMGEMIDAINVNRINLLEESGVYSKDKADDYRERKGYVPLFREVLDDLAQGDAGVREYFNGFADIGREFTFTGSEKASKHVINNLLQQHFWATNAALRNNANYKAAKQVALHDENNELILTEIKPEGNTSAPVFVEGKRNYAEYSDPSLAIGIQGALPVYTGALAWFGEASRLFRIGITANPIFQAYQVVNDALGAAMYSGVSNPFQLGKRIIGGFVGDQFMGSTQAIDAQMARLGVAGGFGRTSREQFMKAQRALGVDNMTKWQKLTDSVESFASKSDLAQRRGIFQQTLIETGGVLQANGTVEGGNQVLAMNRSLNIINWQKRGASGFVRAMTHIIPFANAYLQGMDVLINAMTGKGLSGTDAQTARALFLKTALTLTLINAVYSMLVAGSEEYDELDDRIKFRNYIVPGTGFKLPVRAEISLLTKFIPEQTYQVVSKMNTVDEIDATKLRQAMSLALMDAALGPNLFPQAIRGGVEVATNYNFYTGRPLIGLGLNRLATEEQYNEATSQLAKLLGQTGMIAPINADHLIRSYFGTIGATALFTIDQGANVFFDEKLPAPRLKDFPIISPLIYSAQGRDRLNDFYDLKEASDEVTATVNRLTKYDPKKAVEYRKDNRKLLATRSQVNLIAKRLKDLRARRKQVIESTMDATAKRKALENLDKQMSLTARSISRLRIASGL